MAKTHSFSPISHHNQPIQKKEQHLRRLAEAMALKLEDYENVVFTICRSISARKLVNKTKTGEIHVMPRHLDFELFIDIEIKKANISEFFSTCLSPRNKGKRYSHEILSRIWKQACKRAGTDIDLYFSLKHSSCSQYINEKGLSESELQIITDQARIESVISYAKTEISRKKELMVKTF